MSHGTVFEFASPFAETHTYNFIVCHKLSLFIVISYEKCSLVYIKTVQDLSEAEIV
jgi:hypothetical protein